MNRYYIATERADLFDVNMVVVVSVDIIGLLEKYQNDMHRSTKVTNI